MTLAKVAASGMLRMPQRQASNDGMPQKLGRRHRSSKRSTRRKELKNVVNIRRRNVGEILTDAIRELAIDDDTLQLTPQRLQ